MWKRLVAMVAALCVPLHFAHADAVADFYKGKTVQLVVGYGPGGGYDIYARLVARYMGKYIPGAPAVVVANMPGAGSLRATNFLFATASKDGLTIGAFARDMPLMGILGGNSNVQFDPRKFIWLGSPSSAANDSYLLFVRTDAAVRNVAEAIGPGAKTLVISGTAEGATGNDVAILLRDVIGLNVKIINGYPDSGAMFLAVDRREVEGRFVGISAVASAKPAWLKPDGGMHVILQFGRVERNPRFHDAPTAHEFAKDDNAHALLALAELPYQLSRPFVVPPGTQVDRARALQAAFIAVQTDAQYQAEAARLGLDISPVGGAQAAALIARLATAPPELMNYMRKLQHPEK